MNRARAVLVAPIGASHLFSFNVSRLRQMLSSIEETEGVEAALSRLRTLVTDVAQVSGLTFTLKVSRDVPAGLGVEINWLEWEASPVIDGVILRQVVRSESFSVAIRHTATAAIELEQSATIVVKPF